MRTTSIVGNWKMYPTTGIAAPKLAVAVRHGLGDEGRVRVTLCPPFLYLKMVAETIAGSKIGLGAQNVYPEKEGAFTGEVSPPMLVDVGCTHVIIGHSERRQKLGENDAFVNRKVHVALAAGLHTILCIGETLEERQAQKTEKVLDAQLTAGLAGVTGTMLTNLSLAYEPIWAIGTGHNATPEQAQQAHAFIRRQAAELCGAGPAQSLIIHYGGSVKPDNAASLLSQPDVDGALVGGASLQAEQFLAIVRAGV
jgi:triosephosphate isomerase (TIM)